MKKLSLFFSLASLMAYGADHVSSVELLYFKPTLEQSYYSISGNHSFNGANFPQGTRHNNDPGFQPGFRLEGIYGTCDRLHALDFRFAYFNESNTERISGTFLFDTKGYPGDGAQTPSDTFYSGIAKYTQHFIYYGADATLNRFSFFDCLENFSLILGLHFAKVQMQERASSDGTSSDDTILAVTNRFRRRSHFWGLGPQLGFEYRYRLFSRCGILSLGTNARAALLATHTWADLQYTSERTGDTSVHLNNDPLWRVNPTIDIKVGLFYNCPFRCLNMTYEIGYEMLWYSDAVDSIIGYDVAFAGDTFDHFSSLHLQGPYFAVKVAF